MEIDFEEEPPEFEVSPTHYAKTWLLHPLAKEFKQGVEERDRRRSEEAAAKPVESFDYSTAKKLLEIKNLSVSFKGHGGKFKAVDNVSFDIYQGETLSLVGESGSGKTTIGRAIMRIYDKVEGDIYFDGEKITGPQTKQKMKDLRMKMQMFFQDPMASLNERAKVDYIISEGLHNYHLYDNEQNRKGKIGKIMREVGLSPEFASRFPHEFSGGQRQRIGIARSLVMQPEFIVADEPISALDVSIRAQIINLLNQLRRERDLTYLFIAHDLSVVRFISDRIAVITKGKIVEIADCEELFAHPLHPYTKALLSAIPYPDPDMAGKSELLTYDPSVHDYENDQPVWTEIVPGHYILGNQKELSEYREELGL
ncbi:MAG: ABC transporter ATP-binding protein [Lachnospiraceae bacterium]|nr:ABC transporter ATP-binding protein [Lachnospiraceae bacterium]